MIIFGQGDNMEKKKKKYIKYIISLSILIVLFVILMIFRTNSSLSDFFCLNVSSKLVFLIGSFSSLLPFSLFEVVFLGLCITLLLFVVLLITSLIKNRKVFIKRLFNLLLFILIICDVYIAVCGVSYQRSEIELPFYEGEVTSTLVDETISYYLDDYNKLASSFSQDEKGVSKCPYSFKELAIIMQEECKRLNDFDYYYSFTARPKGTWFSSILSELQITGVDFPLTCEANINNKMPTIDLPFTMAHEIAHLKGVMREDDANTVALYVCITSDVDYVRYSGYFHGFSRLLEIKAFTNNKEYKEILKKINQQIYVDNADYNKYFEEHDLLEKISTFVNDIYLSINGQKEGTNSYNDVSQSVPSGVDEEGNEIRTYTSYSKYQKLMIENYLNHK